MSNRSPTWTILQSLHDRKCLLLEIKRWSSAGWKKRRMNYECTFLCTLWSVSNQNFMTNADSQKELQSKQIGCISEDAFAPINRALAVLSWRFYMRNAFTNSCSFENRRISLSLKCITTIDQVHINCTETYFSIVIPTTTSPSNYTTGNLRINFCLNMLNVCSEGWVDKRECQQ